MLNNTLLLAGVICIYFRPGTIESYDLLLTIDDFKNIFENIPITDSEIIKSIRLLGFNHENRLDDFFFTKLVT